MRLDGFSYDLARSRRETYPQPGALPEVEPAPLIEDLTRRDFTANAIALALGGEDAGTLTAAPDALGDLDARLLRVLHDRSFVDDPTRLLRLARYASRLGFTIEPHTHELAEQAVRAGAVRTVSGSRLGAELRLLAREPDPLGAFETMGVLDLDGAIEPGFGLADPELARRALALLPRDGRPDLLVLAVSACEVAPARLSGLLDELAFAASERETILAATRDAAGVAEALSSATRPSEIAAAAERATPELVALAGALGPSDAATEWLERLRRVQLEIDGNDLLAAGVPEGPAVGRGLRAALRAKIDGESGGREEELQAALDAARD
jgi:tRNA nucleotidyltransferase (CCA-adding enzyme)